MNTRNAFHGLDENLQALTPNLTCLTTSPASTEAASEASNLTKLETLSKKAPISSRSKSLLEEDSYFARNLPPTYDMQPQAMLSEDESTVLGLMNDKCSSPC